MIENESPIGPAMANFLDLSQMPYPGRGVGQGVDETGKYAVQLVFQGGRKLTSRQRRLVERDRCLATEPLDETAEQDPLTLYTAMSGVAAAKFYVATNGNHTNTVLDTVATHGASEAFRAGMLMRTYEPDTWRTSRIGGACILQDSSVVFEFGVLRKSPWSKHRECDFSVRENIEPGVGYLTTTYAGNQEDPLVPPAEWLKLMPILGDIDAVLNAYWGALNENTRVALGVRFIEIETGRITIRTANQF